MASKSRHRTPSGQRSRAGQEREAAPVAIKRLRDAALAGMTDPEWGSELGRLYLNNVITSAMYAAGKRWAEQAARYRHVIGAFPVRSAALERGVGASPLDPDSAEGQREAARHREAMERFFAAHAALSTAGDRCESMVRRVCEDGYMPLGFEELLQLRTGLMRLVSHWGIDGRAE